MTGLGWLVAAATAGTPVVYDDAEGPAPLDFVSARTGLPTSQLEGVEVGQLLGAPPSALGAGVLRRCARQAMDGATVRTELARAEAAWGEHDMLAAVDHLDLAVAGLGCLDSLVEGPVAARIFVFRGGLAAERGEEDQARSELRTALAFDPAIAWIDRYPVAGARFLEEERATSTTARVTALPAGSGAGPWIDGKELGDQGAALRAGLHLAQYASPTGIRSGWLAVAGDSVLVVPTSLRGLAIDGMGDPAGRQLAESVVRAALPEAPAVYVVHGGGLWLVTWDGSASSTLEIVPPTGPRGGRPPKEGGKRKRSE